MVWHCMVAIEEDELILRPMAPLHEEGFWAEAIVE